MRIISKKRLRDFWEIHNISKPSLENWYKIAKNSEWRNLSDVKNTFSSVDLVTTDKKKKVHIFNIGGNKYRLITDILYDKKIIYILYIMTHEEYDKENWKKKL